MHGARLSLPRVDFEPSRGMDCRGIFTVRFSYLSLMDCLSLNLNLFLLKVSSSPTSRRGPMSLYDHDPSYESFRPLDVNILQAELHDGQGNSPSIASPSPHYARKMWWENLLDTYSESREES